MITKTIPSREVRRFVLLLEQWLKSLLRQNDFQKTARRPIYQEGLVILLSYSNWKACSILGSNPGMLRFRFSHVDILRNVGVTTQFSRNFATFWKSQGWNATTSYFHHALMMSDFPCCILRISQKENVWTYEDRVVARCLQMADQNIYCKIKSKGVRRPSDVNFYWPFKYLTVFNY